MLFCFVCHFVIDFVFVVLYVHSFISKSPEMQQTLSSILLCSAGTDEHAVSCTSRMCMSDEFHNLFYNNHIVCACGCALMLVPIRSHLGSIISWGSFLESFMPSW